MDHNTKEQLETVNQQIKEMVSIYRGAVGHSGVSENEFWIWYSLVEMDGEYSQQDISGIWSMSKQTVNTIIMNMVRKGYVELDVIPGTRNRKVIRLTEFGKARGEELVRPISLAEQRAFARLPEEDRLACTAAFSRYITILKEEVYGTESK